MKPGQFNEHTRLLMYLKIVLTHKVSPIPKLG